MSSVSPRRKLNIPEIKAAPIRSSLIRIDGGTPSKITKSGTIRNKNTYPNNYQRISSNTIKVSPKSNIQYRPQNVPRTINNRGRELKYSPIPKNYSSRKSSVPINPTSNSKYVTGRTNPRIRTAVFKDPYGNTRL